MITSPGYGIYQFDERLDENDVMRPPSHGDFLHKSANDSGGWCPECRKRDFYSWVEHKCRECGWMPED